MSHPVESMTILVTTAVVGSLAGLVVMAQTSNATASVLVIAAGGVLGAHWSEKFADSDKAQKRQAEIRLLPRRRS